MINIYKEFSRMTDYGNTLPVCEKEIFDRYKPMIELYIRNTEICKWLMQEYTDVKICFIPDQGTSSELIIPYINGMNDICNDRMPTVTFSFYYSTDRSNIYSEIPVVIKILEILRDDLSVIIIDNHIQRVWDTVCYLHNDMIEYAVDIEQNRKLNELLDKIVPDHQVMVYADTYLVDHETGEAIYTPHRFTTPDKIIRRDILKGPVPACMCEMFFCPFQPRCVGSEIAESDIYYSPVSAYIIQCIPAISNYISIFDSMEIRGQITNALSDTQVGDLRAGLDWLCNRTRLEPVTDSERAYAYYNLGRSQEKYHINNEDEESEE